MASNRKNPKNADSLLFKGLTRLFSGPITNYKKQTPRQLKRMQLDKYKFKSASGQPFKKASNYTLADLYANSKKNVNRAERYVEFDMMEFIPEVASSLDIYASEMTTSTAFSKILGIKSSNEEIKTVLENLYYKILNIESNAFGWCRSLCKYGDFFLYLDIDEKLGITSCLGLPSVEIERLEGEDKTNPNYVQFQWNTAALTFENWQVAHFRILGDDKFAPYGVSVLNPIRRISRQLQLQEDAMMAYRIVRSPERRVFYVDVGGLNEKDVEQAMEQVASEMKRSTVIDPTTGQMNLGYNPVSIEQDYFVPVNGQSSGTKIETLPGGTYPVRKDSDIPLLDGRVITIEQLSKEYDEGKENWVYSIQDKTHNIVPGKVVWCGKNYTCNKIHKIWLDDGSFVEMAPEHPVLLRDGTLKRADELKNGDSLMPFYMENGKKAKEKLKGYPSAYNPGTNKYEFVHRLIVNSIGGKEKALLDSGETSAAIHHIDYDKNNNRPDNLKWMGFWEHRDFHKHDELSKKKASSTLRNYLLSDKHRKNIKDIIANSDSGLHKWIYGEKNLNRIKSLSQDIELRRQTSIRNSVRWQNEEFRTNHSGENHHLRKKWIKFYSSYSLKDLQDFCKSNDLIYFNDVVNHPGSFLKAKEQCRKFLKFHGIDTWTEFREKYLDTVKNHKVVNVEIITEIDDVYCMTVVGPNGEDDRHNFAMLGKGIPNVPGKLNGIFVKNTGDIDDVKYLRDKLMAGLKIPHSYLVATEGSVEDKTTLSQKDVQFARTIQRLQKSFVSELEKIGYIHLYVLGYRGKDLLSFSLSLNNPSKIAELQELEHWKTKFDVASSATEGFFSRRWIAKNLFGVSDEEFLRNIREMYFDAQLGAELESIATPGAGDLEGGNLDLGDTDGLDPEGLDTSGEDSMLLTKPGDGKPLPPGKRDDFSNMGPSLKQKGVLTPGANGKVYYPTRSDKRTSGARKRNMRSLYGDESARNTPRNTLKGMSGLSSVARGIFEEYESNYKKTVLNENKSVSDVTKDEEQIFENDKSIKFLFQSLENGFKKKDK